MTLSREQVEAIRAEWLPVGEWARGSLDFSTRSIITALLPTVVLRLADAALEAMRERDALRVALEGVRNMECWCGVGIGDPNCKGRHTPACSAARAALSSAPGTGTEGGDARHETERDERPGLHAVTGAAPPTDADLRALVEMAVLAGAEHEWGCPQGTGYGALYDATAIADRVLREWAERKR